jgi:signal transduction histidine kinase
LSIVKAVVEKAGGSIAIASQPAQGATVTVRLPLLP